MKQKPGRAPREPRESSLASGWTVEGEAAPVAAPADAPLGAEPLRPGPHAGPVAAAASVATPRSEGAGTPSPSPSLAGETRDAELEAELEAERDERPQMSNGALVVLGVFGGLYLLYTWGWFIIAQAYSGNNAVTAAGSGLIGGVLQQIVFWAAPLAAPLWFFTALALSRGGRTKRLAILLLVGAVVLVPLPMLIARGA
ncbi:hypothetical protein [Leucobacter chromiiresistens]|uniref:DNA polymerase III subunit gamma/tau n=2 Tax=Leucobacter chromiiresistens TaxID=1079994 RepID=A0A1H1BRD9_9MICO|nr:hypothetical protein [Leucobacter chromiiresistens]SDQ54512.1 hypothetical protein SAMN04488565_2997 [Leucobacter chromiiresistens]